MDGVNKFEWLARIATKLTHSVDIMQPDDAVQMLKEVERVVKARTPSHEQQRREINGLAALEAMKAAADG